MAVINHAVAGLLAEKAREVEIINVSSGTLARGLRYHWVRLRRTIHGMGRILRADNANPPSVYMSLSGGLGQAYELLFMLAARMKRFRITLHHHSYAYLSRRRLITRLVIAISPAGTQHVALSTGMANCLSRLYGVSNSYVLSNAAFLQDISASSTQARPLAKLGFLSNISKEKGIFDFISLVDACLESGLDVHAVVAGPFQDPETESIVMPLLEERDAIHYLGPQYGEAKTDFFRSIDVLVFPTRYANEAEPVTIHESLMQGVPVIAYGRGAIPEILDGAHGVSIPAEQEFVPHALNALKRWKEMGTAFSSVRHEALVQFRNIRFKALLSLDDLLEAI